MDWIRTAYKVRMRLWNGSDYAIRVRWFRAPPGARLYSKPTPFRSRQWDTAKQPLPLGEILTGRFSWDRGRNDQLYQGLNHCGADRWFFEGGVIGTTPYILTDELGDSPCCFRLGQLAQGGAQVGGSASFIRSAFGGAQVGGAGAFSTNGINPAVGGAQLGGAAFFGGGIPWSAAGGALVGGAAGFGASNRMIARGGAQVGGAASPFGLVNFFTSKGGAIVERQGPAPVAGPFFPAKGGLWPWGGAALGRGLYLPGLGGAQVNGSAKISGGPILPALGGAIVNGSADLGGGPILPAIGGAIVNGTADFPSGSSLEVVGVRSQTDQSFVTSVEHPSESEAGDLLLWFCAWTGGTTYFPSAPGGFSTALTHTISSALAIAIGYKTDSGSEPSNYFAYVGPGEKGSACIIAIRGWSGLTTSASSAGGTGTSAQAPDETATVNGSLAVNFYFFDQGASPSAVTGWTATVGAIGTDAGCGAVSKGVNSGTVAAPIVTLNVSATWGASIIVVDPV